MSIVEFLSQPLWQRLGLTLVHFLWQGLAVAVLVGVLVRVFRLNHGNARYAAYLPAFIAMIVCPVVTFTAIDITISPNTELVTGAESTEVIDSSPYTALSAGDILPEAETSSPAIPTLANSIPLSQRISDWLNVSMPWVLVIWMVGVIVLSVRLLMGFVGVYRWRHHLQPLPERLAQRVASLSERLCMRGFLRVFISPTVLQAMAVGYLRPMVLLPAAMVARMQPEMLEAVIAHELAHIRRFDLWVNLIQRVTETLLFYHPAVWWLSICLRSERELCCDELAVKATGERITYASTLENVGRARFVAKPPILAAGLGQDNKPTLGRVRHILGLTPTQRNCPFWLAGVITVLFLAALVIPTTLALTNQSDEKLMHFESVVVEGIRANRDKFKCGYLAWSNTRINEAVVDRVDKELTGQYELWWDGKKIATKYVRDQLYKGPEGNFWVEKQQGGDSYDGGVLSRKPNFRSDNWLGPHITRWRGVGSQDWLIRQDSKQENISRSWSVVDSDGAKLIRVISRNMNETSRDYRAYGIRDYDPSKGYGQVYEEWFNPDDSTRMKNTVKLMEVILGGWFPVEVNFKSASMEDGVRVDHNNNYKLDVERCSFNDKSALPDRVFKGAVDKQLKYQEKLQKYLAMELEGISHVKEIDKADKVKLGAREAIEKFVAAAMAGDFEKARQFADPNKAPASQIADLTEVAKGQNLWIMAVVADDFSAIAVSSVIQGDHERIGPLVFFLDRVALDGRDNWWVHDIDMETPDGAEVKLKQFLEKHPKAKKVPYEKKAAGAEVSNDFMAMGDDQGDIRVITNDPAGVQRIKALLIKPEIVTTSDGRAKLMYFGRYVYCRDLAKLVGEKIGFITDKDITCNDGKNQISIVCPTTGDAETVLGFLQEIDQEPIQVHINVHVVEAYSDVELDWETRKAVKNITRTKTTSNAKPEKSLSAADILRETAKTEPQPDNSNSIEKLIDLLASRGYLKILMNPRVEVINGKTARIMSRSSLAKDEIEVTPHVFADKTVQLETRVVIGEKIIPESNKLKPIVSKIEIRNNDNRIKIGESLVIGGGTKTEKRAIVRNGVKDSEERTKEVLVILTPTIITPGMNLSKKPDVQVEGEEATLEEFRKKAWKVFGLPPGVMGYLDSCVMVRKEMNPEQLITVYCVDKEGKGISYCRVVFVDRGEQIRLIDNVATDEKGYAYCDDIDGPFSIMAQVFDYSPLTKAWRFQHKKIEKLYNANDKPVITVQWPPFPEGIGQIQGNIKDQYDHPLKEFDLVLTQREGQNEGWGDCFTKQIKKHFIHPEGNFEIGNLTAGTYTYFVYPKEQSAYVWDFNMGEVTVGAEDTVQLNIKIEAKKPDVPVEGEGIKTEIQKLVNGFWTAVTAKDWQAVNEYSEMDILKQRAGALEDVLAEAAPERKKLLSRGINISQIDEVYVNGKEAIAIGPANKERFQWYYLQKRADVWVIKLFDDAPPRLSVQDVFFKCRSVDKLVLMGERLTIYAAEHQGKLPENLEALEPYILDKRLRAWLRKHVEYLGKGKEMEKIPNSIVAYTKTLVSKDENISVLFNDGNVGFVLTSQVERDK